VGLEYLDSSGGYNPNTEDGFGQLSFIQVVEENLTNSSEEVHVRENPTATTGDDKLEADLFEISDPPLSEEGSGEHESQEQDPPEQETPPSSALPTMWLGAQSGFVYVHSAIAQWEKCLHKVRLPDSVLSIAYVGD